jgi:ribosomal protein L23
MRGGKRATGFTSSWKKAYVTLAENQKIDLFEGA